MKRLILKGVWFFFSRSGISAMLSDRLFTEILYFCQMGKRLDLTRPTDFNQKELWLKLYTRNPLWVKCADKYEVREYVARKIGTRYLNECFGVYESVDEIDFAELPNRFVMKASHGSGWNIICTDKRNFDLVNACREMRKWLKSDFSTIGREWHYHKIKPRIVCEAFLEEPNGGALLDYKMFTFNGETKYISVEGVDNGVGFVNFYDANWNYQKDKHSVPMNKDDAKVRCPECLEEMKVLARELAGCFPMCRVDFYALGGRKIVFGELTFTPGKGCNAFEPQTFCEELGSYIRLPEGRTL